MRSVNVTEVPADAQFIDVREPDEYAQGHARGAINIPMSEFVGRIGEISTERDVYLICKLGGRSRECGEYLEQARGGERVINVEGGTEAWREQGLPIVE
ncbi:rhodanese-like domain-containing protein [Corynebacterium mastitidis]|uniref:rhodanese-like domain-containing protein n=1 Tax=Corynebacterium mastitidis TaxID=161890 RepID=UPI0003612A74|nr:rhodanese-like domain-containing protein [Corynebacterium mastitidis]